MFVFGKVCRMLQGHQKATYSNRWQALWYSLCRFNTDLYSLTGIIYKLFIHFICVNDHKWSDHKCIWDSSLPQNSTNGRLYLGWWFVVLRRRHLAVFGCSNHVKGWANAGTLPTIGVWSAPFIRGFWWVSGGSSSRNTRQLFTGCPLGRTLRCKASKFEMWFLDLPPAHPLWSSNEWRRIHYKVPFLVTLFPNWQNRCLFQADITDVHVLFQVFKWNLSILSSASQKLWSDVSRQKQNGAVIIPDHRHRGLVFGGLHSPWVWCHRHQTIGLSMAYRL